MILYSLELDELMTIEGIVADPNQFGCFHGLGLEGVAGLDLFTSFSWELVGFL